MKKLTYEFVKKQFENRGYTLISKEYKNNRTKLDYICNEGHIGSITYRDFQSGRGCYICGRKSIARKRRLCFCNIVSSFEEEGYKVFNPKEGYINVEQKLDFICNKGHKGKISYHNWMSGWRCKKCLNEKLSILFSGKGHPNWKGGKSFEQYCDVWRDNEYKQDIHERDGNRCLNPYCNSKNPADLTIHHIDYNKKNCKPNNLITVCRSCNSRANTDREWHKAWYQAVLKMRYNYIYTKEE